MFGFHPVSTFPFSDVKDTLVSPSNRNAKVKTWTVPTRTTKWSIPVCKVDATVSKQGNTWTIPS
jgi:hypothetical protein